MTRAVGTNPERNLHTSLQLHIAHAHMISITRSEVMMQHGQRLLSTTIFTDPRPLLNPKNGLQQIMMCTHRCKHIMGLRRRGNETHTLQSRVLLNANLVSLVAGLVESSSQAEPTSRSC